MTELEAVREKIAIYIVKRLWRLPWYGGIVSNARKHADQILSLPEIAILAKDQRQPANPYPESVVLPVAKGEASFIVPQHNIYKQAQQDMSNFKKTRRKVK